MEPQKPSGQAEEPKESPGGRQVEQKNIRAADAKEVGVGNPAEETYCHPNILYYGAHPLCQLRLSPIWGTIVRL